MEIWPIFIKSWTGTHSFSLFVFRQLCFIDCEFDVHYFQFPSAWLLHQMKAFGGDFSTATNKWYIVGCAPHELILPSDSALSDMSKDVYHAFDIIFRFLFGFQLIYFRGQEIKKKYCYSSITTKVWSIFLSILLLCWRKRPCWRYQKGL